MNPAFVAFESERRIAAGDLGEVVRAAKQLLDRRKDAAVLVFDGRTSALVDIDYRGSVDDVLKRLPKPKTPAAEEHEQPAPAPRGPGRPRLGVVAREITLLPRHWDWLAQQKGGASVAIRKLIDEARRSSGDKDRTRLAQDAAYRFMTTMAGNRPHYEDAIRALFVHDRRRFSTLIADWPADIRDHAIALAYSDQAD
ncbi:DUF2239 family protein [Bradyrhizobium sp. WSM 1704]|uniref:DUF2239 family protein n=1 Tax=Bradyrhizobium semiaridum TaxID=2821404 RepID=UPI001CE2E971|nr:DUF2239 family protein [Bradyrhizobium semiaridum]MCA6123384.1 DUF2239 family protein [Bradyrhizobium semiaridum]